jgi:protein SCO1/2
MNKTRGMIILLVLIVIPALWVMLWKKGEYQYNKLPVLGEIGLTGDTIPFTISNFELLDQNGDTVSFQTVEDKVYVANFFFTSCPDICPKMNTNLSIVVDKFQSNPAVVFISHTVDPETDSVAVLKDYARRFKADANKWHFVTGKKSIIYDKALHDYRVNATTGAEETDFIHSEKLILIDKDKRIRGYYDGLDFNEVKELMDAIRILLKEYADEVD